MKKFLWLFLAPASASSLLAQTPAPVTPEVPRTTTTMLHAMSQAGPVMVVLLILSIISVMLVIVYFLSIRRGAVVLARIRVFRALDRGRGEVDWPPV